MTTLLSKIKAAHKDGHWFDRETKKFFGDVRYYAYRSKTGKPYLVRSTYGFSDMFGQVRKLSYKINIVNPETLKIEDLIPLDFSSLEAVKYWIYIESLAETIEGE